MSFSAKAPAKLNLSLAVVGRDADGFHRLVSCVAPLVLCDDLAFTTGGSADTLACDDASIPVDDSNLVLRAAAAFRKEHPDAPFGRFVLRKNIPHGAGLGGGSSDAAAALRLLNEASGHPLDPERLRAVAARVGSDCAFFVQPAPSVMRGRGERLSRIPDGLAAAYRGRRVLLVKPSFGVSTAAAYGWLATAAAYAPETEAERLLAEALRDPAQVLALGNSLQAPVFARHPELPAGLLALRDALGVAAVMTGSGSACFGLLGSAIDPAAVRSVLAPHWGPGVWVALTEIA